MNWKRTIWVNCILVTLQLQAQSEGGQKELFNRYGLRTSYGAIVVHSADVENTSGSRPLTFEFEWSRRKKGADVWNTCRCYPTTGAVFGLQYYDNSVLGIGIHGAYFVQYHFLQRARLSPAIRGTGGLTYNSKPYHSIKNPTNQSYSLPVNFSVQLAALLDFRITDYLSMDLALSFNHISNGGIRQPNKGINWSSVGLGVYYTPDFSEFENRSGQYPERNNKRNWFYRLEAYGSGHTKIFNDNREFFWVAGLEPLVGYYVGNLNSLIGGFDWNYDDSRKKHAIVHELSGTPHRLGIHLGHEFVLGKFRFSQKVGAYLLDRFRLHDPIYHKWGIAYLHKSGVLAGIELKAHRHVAEFIVGKIGWQF